MRLTIALTLSKTSSFSLDLERKSMRKCHLALALTFLSIPICHAQSIGIFTEHTDVGSVLHSGSATYDSSKNSYTLVGSGENMWATADAFQFAWKKISGD